MKLLITNKRTLSTARGDEHLAAKLMGIDSEQVEWAIEEYGRCDANIPNEDEYVAIQEEFRG